MTFPSCGGAPGSMLPIGFVSVIAAAQADENAERLGIAPESWLKPWTWRNDELVEATHAARLEKLTSFQGSIIALATICAIAFVASSLFGPWILDRLRAKLVVHLRLTNFQIKALVIAGYSAAVAVCSVLLVTSEPVRLLALPLLILIGGTLFDLRTRALPAIDADDREKFKAAISRIKTAFLLALVFVVAIQMLLGGLVNLDAK